MKNLKRILCVVLVVALCCGMILTAGATAGSDKYADYDSITNQSAVDVVTELGIFEGKDDNLFDPTGNLTRGEMAKVAFAIMTARELTTSNTFESIRDKYTNVGAKFSDVTADQWFAGYIGYGVTNGTIAGFPEGDFRPDTSVSYAEAAKVLLCMLGYDADVEGLTGNTFEAMTLKLGLKAGLFDGVDTSDIMQPISRDEYAQVVYNALMANMVTYITATVDGVLVSIPVAQLEDLIDAGANITGITFNPTVALDYYFIKETQVTEGIVVANGYANLLEGSSETRLNNSYLYLDNERWTPSNSGVTSYDPATQTIVLVPADPCIGTGACSGNHNTNNANCPANQQPAELMVVESASGKDVIGRAVKVNEIGNLDVDNGTDNSYYVDIVATAANQVDTINTLGLINDQTDLTLVENTVVHAADTALTTRDGGSSAFTALTAAQAAALALVPGFQATVIDNDGDNDADYVIALEKQLGLVTYVDNEAPYVDTDGVTHNWPIVEITANGAGDSIVIEYPNVLEPADPTTLAVSDTVYYYEDLVDNFYIAELDPDMGALNVVTGSGEEVTIDYDATIAESALDYNRVTIGGVEYVISQNSTRDVADVLAAKNLNQDVIFWLDEGGYIVKAQLVASVQTVTGMVYGYNPGSNNPFVGYGSSVKFVNAAGEETTYNFRATQLDTEFDKNVYENVADLGASDVNNTGSVIAGYELQAALVHLYLYDGEVVGVDLNVNTKDDAQIDADTPEELTYGSLVMGATSAAMDTEASAEANGTPIVTDDTNFFYLTTPKMTNPETGAYTDNFRAQSVVVAKGINSLQQSDEWTANDMINKVVQYVVDPVTNYVTDVYVDIDYMTYNAIPPVENAANDMAEDLIVISADDFYNNSDIFAEETVDAGLTYKVPVVFSATGAVAEINVTGATVAKIDTALADGANEYALFEYTVTTVNGVTTYDVTDVTAANIVTGDVLADSVETSRFAVEKADTTYATYSYENAAVLVVDANGVVTVGSVDDLARIDDVTVDATIDYMTSTAISWTAAGMNLIVIYEI